MRALDSRRRRHAYRATEQGHIHVEGLPAAFCAISILLATLSLPDNVANPVTNFFIIGAPTGGGFGSDPRIGCGQCALHACKAGGGKRLKIEPLSDDASIRFVCVAGSASYDLQRNTIAFVTGGRLILSTAFISAVGKTGIHNRSPTTFFL
ncbi:MAG TPA: hypothetical protein VMF58_02035 [Rhizomicrobium sp.]|nr:hypothetical protein [Rhizomicrobium sp.]